jgi:peptidoglycan/LPS O-acetylase OafA/YrhL
VLSGFVLTWSHRRDDSAVAFYRRRFARVWPLHALTTLLAIPVVLAEGGRLDVLLLGLTLLLVQAWSPRDSVNYAYNGVSWSLSCEAFFYAAFPVVYQWAARVTRAQVILVVTGIVFVMSVAIFGTITLSPSRAEYLLFVSPPYRMLEFMAGVFLGHFVRSNGRFPADLRGATALLIGGYAAGSVWTQAVGRPLELYIGDALVLPGVVALIGSAASKEMAGSAPAYLSARPLILLGRWSFALYLVHELLLRILLGVVHFPLSVGATLAVAVGVVFSAIALSGLLHHIFEQPVERRLRGARARPEAEPPPHGEYHLTRSSLSP